MSLSSATQQSVRAKFQHSAAFYRGMDGLVETLRPFVREGVEHDEPVLVALLPDRIEALRSALGTSASAVSFLDMSDVGANPARIIPAWREFVDAHADGASFRGVGEPIWSGRRDAEIVECHLHESLLNVAFDDGPGWQLLCPYDEASLRPDVLREARRTHPEVWTGHGAAEADYEGHDHAREVFSEPLDVPSAVADVLEFDAGDLTGLRDVVSQCAARAGVGRDRVEDLTLAAHELATNSILHGGGYGTLLAWREPGAFVVEIRDSGRITDPMVGRQAADGSSEGGRGLWIANHLCDLVQVRSGTYGTVVRLHCWL